MWALEAINKSSGGFFLITQYNNTYVHPPLKVKGFFPSLLTIKKIVFITNYDVVPLNFQQSAGFGDPQGLSTI
jgi:hypothetical protein